MNFLSLVNDVNHRLNEVPLTQSTFNDAQGFYHQAKEAVNSSLRDINQDVFEWPFNHVTEELVLTPEQVRYEYPSDAKSINLDSFRLKGDTDKNIQTTYLGVLDYEEYLKRFSDADHSPSKYATIPRLVFRTPDLHFGVYPPPIDDYTLIYEYYRLPEPLINFDDEPYLPGQFRHIIVDGAMHYAFMFRGDPESSAVMLEKFRQGLKNMRKIYQNRYEYVRSGFRPRTYEVGTRVYRT